MALTRRSVLKYALGGAGVMLAAACAPAAPPTNTPAPAKPAEAPKPAAAAPTKPAPAPAAAPTAAAAATKPAAAAAIAAPAAKPSAAIKPGTKLVFVTQTGQAAADRFNPLIAKFKEKTGADVESIAAGASAAELQQKVLTLIAGNSPMDIFFTHTYTNPGLARRKVPLGLADLIKSDSSFKIDEWLPASIEDFKYQGTQFAMPFITTSTVLAYNKKLFDEAGVKPPTADWTWDDYTDIAVKMNKPGQGASRVYGTAGFVQAGFSWYTLIRAWHEGSDIVNQDRTKYALNDAGGIRAVQWIADLVHKHKVHATGVEITPTGANEAFATGRIAMMPTISDYSALVKVPFEWDLQHLPKSPQGKQITRNASAGHSIYSGTKAPEASWEFMKTIYSKDGADHLSKFGVLLPTHKEIAEKVVSAGAGGKSPKNAKIGLDAMAYSRPEPVVGDWIAVHRELTTAMEGVLGPNARPIKEALDSIAARVNEAIAKEPSA